MKTIWSKIVAAVKRVFRRKPKAVAQPVETPPAAETKPAEPPKPA